MCTDGRTDAQGRHGARTHIGALFTLKKEESPAICDSTDGPAGHYSKQSKSETHTTDLPSLRDQRQTGPRSRGNRRTAVTQRCHEGHRLPVTGKPGSGTWGAAWGPQRTGLHRMPGHGEETDPKCSRHRHRGREVSGHSMGGQTCPSAGHRVSHCICVYQTATCTP